MDIPGPDPRTWGDHGVGFGGEDWGHFVGPPETGSCVIDVHRPHADPDTYEWSVRHFTNPPDTTVIGCGVESSLLDAGIKCVTVAREWLARRQ